MSSLQSHVPLPHRSHMRLTRSSPSLVLPDLIRSGVAMRSSSLSKALSSSSSTAVPGPPAEPLLPLIVSVEAISPLKELSAHIKAIEVRFRAWMAKQPTHIEAAVSTTVGAVQGGWRSRGGGGGGSWDRARPTVGRRSLCRSRHPTPIRRPCRHSSRLRFSSSSNSVFSCVSFLMLLVEIGPFDPEIRITDVLIHLYGMFV
jgi:hypothetical protein